MRAVTFVSVCLLSTLVSTALSARAEDKLNVVTTLPDLAEIARAVGGDRVEVSAIASGLQDPHFVDPKPSYVVKLRDADLLIVNGLDLEIGWIPPLVDGAHNPKINRGAAGYIDASKNIPVLELPSGEVNRAQGDVHPFGNPHYLTDPLNWKIVADTVAEALKRSAPADAAGFEARKKAFQKKIDTAMFGASLVDEIGGGKLDRLTRAGELDGFLAQNNVADKLGGWMKSMRVANKSSIVFFHKSYSYFTARFGIKVADYVEQKAGIQPGPGHLAELVQQIRREKIPLIGTHAFYDASIARLVAEKSGAKLLVLPLGVGGVKGADDVFAYFDNITGQLAGVLGK